MPRRRLRWTRMSRMCFTVYAESTSAAYGTPHARRGWVTRIRTGMGKCLRAKLVEVSEESDTLVPARMCRHQIRARGGWRAAYVDSEGDDAVRGDLAAVLRAASA